MLFARRRGWGMKGKQGDGTVSSRRRSPSRVAAPQWLRGARHPWDPSHHQAVHDGQYLSCAMLVRRTSAPSKGVGAGRGSGQWMSRGRNSARRRPVKRTTDDDRPQFALILLPADSGDPRRGSRSRGGGSCLCLGQSASPPHGRPARTATTKNDLVLLFSLARPQMLFFWWAHPKPVDTLFGQAVPPALPTRD